MQMNGLGTEGELRLRIIWVELKFQIDDFEVGPEPARVLRNDSAFQGSELLMAVQLERPHSGLAKAVEFDREKKRWHNSKLLGKRL